MASVVKNLTLSQVVAAWNICCEALDYNSGHIDVAINQIDKELLRRGIHLGGPVFKNLVKYSDDMSDLHHLDCDEMTDVFKALLDENQDETVYMLEHTINQLVARAAKKYTELTGSSHGSHGPHFTDALYADYDDEFER